MSLKCKNPRHYRKLILFATPFPHLINIKFQSIRPTKKTLLFLKNVYRLILKRSRKIILALKQASCIR